MSKLNPQPAETAALTAAMPAFMAGGLKSLKHHDLNALPVLFAVLQTGSVSGAARLFDLSQPTVSRTLDRLRQEFDDPLVIRQGNGVVATQKGKALYALLGTMLDVVQQVYAPAIFKPSTARRQVSIAMTEHLQQLLMPALLRRVSAAAPGLRLLVRPLRSDGEEALMMAGRLDLSIGMLLQPGTLRQQPLMSQRLICLARKDVHAELQGQLPLSKAVFRTFPQIDVQPAGLGNISARIEALFTGPVPRRNVLCVLSSFSALIGTLSSARCLGVLPERAYQPALHADMVEIPLAFALPRYEVSVWWHNVAHRDPLLQWLRGELVDLCREEGLTTDGRPITRKP